MSFISLDLENLLTALNKLQPTAKPKWGKMSAQRMVEHLSESIALSMDKNHGYALQIPKEKIEAMQTFLAGDKPFLPNFKVIFAPESAPLKHDELELAIDEFVDVWLSFEDYASEQDDSVVLHPYYGELTVEQWTRMHQKHITHHFEQFELI